MSTLLLRLAGPWQAWGEARFAERTTRHAPTKSGIIGLLAAAKGLRRQDPLEDLLALDFGVRIDQPGRVERDFQTAITKSGKALPLTIRYYLSDAVFLAGVSGDDDFIRNLDHALHHPVFPLFLGRRSCPPAGPVTLGVRETALWDSLREEPWQASLWWRKRQQSELQLEVRIDRSALPESVNPEFSEITVDAPVSFNPEWRRWDRREICVTHKVINNPDSKQPASHDPMSLLGGA